jgi:two-component system sensor histidine kinase SenX3
VNPLVTGLVGLVVGGLLVVLAGWLRLARTSRPGRPSKPAPAAPAATPGDRFAGSVVDGLHIGVVVGNSSGDVLLANPAAEATGVVQRGRIATADLRHVAAAVRRDGEPRERVLDPIVGRIGREPAAVRARVSRLPGTDEVLLLLEDITESRRVDAARRDFVANVSHELKTPVGALSLLAEAVADACDEPAAVRRFAGRMGHEANRLGRLVQELIDLSRLQGVDPLPEPVPVRVDQVVREAVDRTRLAAAAAGIEVRAGGDPDIGVLGSESQLVTALVNLVSNAIAYSPAHTRVAVGIRQAADTVEISVTDQGIGIAENDLERVFERFYRADPARSRATGGTGLGLAIVKHIATNHGGSVDVWSVERSGSTFTLRLPILPDPDEIRAPAGAVPMEVGR